MMPGTVVFSPHTKLREALTQMGGAIAQDSTVPKFIFGTVDSLQNCMLVHINPPVAGDGGHEYNGDTVYSFASDYVFQELVKLHTPQMLAEALFIIIYY